MIRKRIFIIGSCVSRDLFDLTDKYEIAGCVSRSSLASAFADKPFAALNDDLIESRIQSNWQRQCVRNDLGKALPSLLKEKEYDAIVLDFVEERFKLLLCDGAKATLSREFARTGLQKKSGMKTLRPANWRRRRWWKQGLEELMSIAREKNIPVYLNVVFPATYDNAKKPFHRWSVFRENLRLRWFYRQVPADVTRFKVPADLVVGDSLHKWGRSPFHYSPAVYDCLLGQLNDALGAS